MSDRRAVLLRHLCRRQVPALVSAWTFLVTGMSPSLVAVGIPTIDIACPLFSVHAKCFTFDIHKFTPHIANSGVEDGIFSALKIGIEMSGSRRDVFVKERLLILKRRWHAKAPNDHARLHFHERGDVIFWLIHVARESLRAPLCLSAARGGGFDRERLWP